jgi:predicted P-loop ATPase
MTSIKRSDVDSVKSFLTRPKDRIRKPYDRMTTDLPRQSIFIGTINPYAGGGYLKDPTGNRRFWPVTVGDIKVDALAEIRDQLWAEAKHIYDKGELLYLPESLEALAREEQTSRMIEDPIEDDILRFIENVVEYENVFTAVSVVKSCLDRVPNDSLLRRASDVINKYYVKGTYYCKAIKKNLRGYRKDRIVKID